MVKETGYITKEETDHAGKKKGKAKMMQIFLVHCLVYAFSFSIVKVQVIRLADLIINKINARKIPHLPHVDLPPKVRK